MSSWKKVEDLVEERKTEAGGPSPAGEPAASVLPTQEEILRAALPEEPSALPDPGTAGEQAPPVGEGENLPASTGPRHVRNKNADRVAAPKTTPVLPEPREEGAAQPSAKRYTWWRQG